VTAIPLFPLGTVLFPGVLLPLHVFEPRYRLLVQHLVSLPDGSPRQFGVVGIREGREAGSEGVRSLQAVGCIAELGQVEPFDDGRFDIVSLGTRRFRLLGVDASQPYLQGEVEELSEVDGPADEALVERVQDLFIGYRNTLAEARGGLMDPQADLPDDPSVLSYFVAATTVLDLADKQTLLETGDAHRRLLLEVELLKRETSILRALPSLPGLDPNHDGTVSVN
jgi:Lon protease-like protein